MTGITDRDIIKDTNDFLSPVDIKTTPFSQNVSGEHAYKRAERIVSALYLVTNHVSYDEPLRARLRSIGHEILSGVLSLRRGFKSVGHEEMLSLISQIRELATHVQLLRVAGYVSSANSNILIRAIDELGQFLASSRRSILSEELSFSREDFVPGDAMPRGMSTAHTHMRKVEGDVKAANAAAASKESAKRTSGFYRTSATLKSTVRAKRQQELHLERQRMIMDILKKSGPLAVKDISSNVIGCGEKTVQRELLSLMEEGRIKKSGTKRWSRYEVVL